MKRKLFPIAFVLFVLSYNWLLSSWHTITTNDYSKHKKVWINCTNTKTRNGDRQKNKKFTIFVIL